MTIHRKTLAVGYVGVGFIALVLTWLHLTPYLSSGFFRGTLLFWRDALFEANAASKFLTVDILLLGAVVLVWMIIEARKRNIPGIWLYVPVSLFIGISFAVPVFLAHREWLILKSGEGADDVDNYVELPLSAVLLIVVIFLTTLMGAALTFNEAV